MTAFEEMGILSDLAKAVEEMEWTLPTDIQQEAIPLILGGGDVLMAAETGSGKTGAFSLPVLQIVWETINELPAKRNRSNKQGAINGPDWHLSVTDRDHELVVADDRLLCQSKGNRWQGCRTNRGLRSDSGADGNRFYFEAHFTEPGLARVGWTTANGSLDLGTCPNGWGYGGTAKKSNSRNFSDYGEKYGDKGDVVGCLLDLNSGEISFWKNGNYQDIAFQLPKPITNKVLYPTICTKNAPLRIKLDDPREKPPGRAIWVGRATEAQYVNPTSPDQTGTSAADQTAPKAIIIEPSRELAEQTYKCLLSFNKHLTGKKVRLMLIVGGANAKDQMRELDNGVDIIVATPGRLDDLIKNDYVNVRACRFFVVDEIDDLLQKGQKEFINRLHRSMPRQYPDGSRLQMIVCSATLHNFDVRRLAEDLMYFPMWVDLKGEDSVPDTVHHVMIRVDPRKDSSWQQQRQDRIQTDDVHASDVLNFKQPTAETLSEGVKRIKGDLVIEAINKFKMDQGIIFCRTKLDCDNLERHMNRIGAGGDQRGSRLVHPYTCVCLHADRRPDERTRNLQQFKDGECRFLICTDVAARGIDVSGVPFVIQMTLPDEKANYLHRIGRVGRAERMGLAISLVAAVPEKVWYHASCTNRGRGCHNTNLVERKGCCIWYNELQLLGDIEEHLGCTISELDRSLTLETNEFDGKVVYGAKRKENAGFQYDNHVQQLSAIVAELSALEARVQLNYIQMYGSSNRT